MARVFVFGDSHTQALKDALSDYELPNSSLRFDIHWKYKEKKGSARGDLKNEDALRIASSLSENDLLVISLLGTSHNLFGLLKHKIPFYVLTEQPMPDQRIIPVNVIFDAFVDLQKKNKLILELKKSTKARTLHLATPPPKFDNDFIKKFIEKKISVESLHNWYGDIVNPPQVRQALWRIEMESMKVVLEELGISLLPPPGSAMTPSGFLKEDYYASDATHANHRYGSLVIAQMVEFLMAAK